MRPVFYQSIAKRDKIPLMGPKAPTDKSGPDQNFSKIFVKYIFEWTQVLKKWGGLNN